MDSYGTFHLLILISGMFRMDALERYVKTLLLKQIILGGFYRFANCYAMGWEVCISG